MRRRERRFREAEFLAMSGWTVEPDPKEVIPDLSRKRAIRCDRKDQNVDRADALVHRRPRQVSFAHLRCGACRPGSGGLALYSHRPEA